MEHSNKDSTSKADFKASFEGPPNCVTLNDNQGINSNNVERYIQEMMWSEAAQNLRKRGFRPKYIQQALTRMYDVYRNRQESVSEISIMEEFNKIKNEENLSDDDLKIRNADNLRNISVSKDLKLLQKENAEMRSMMLCKGCGVPATCINLGCRHLMCIACGQMLFCKKCASQITKVVDVKFSNQE